METCERRPARSCNPSFPRCRGGSSRSPGSGRRCFSRSRDPTFRSSSAGTCSGRQRRSGRRQGKLQGRKFLSPCARHSGRAVWRCRTAEPPHEGRNCFGGLDFVRILCFNSHGMNHSLWYGCLLSRRLALLPPPLHGTVRAVFPHTALQTVFGFHCQMSFVIFGGVT